MREGGKREREMGRMVVKLNSPCARECERERGVGEESGNQTKCSMC